MKISICTVTARLGFVEHQAKMIAQQRYKNIEWVLVDFAFESRAKMVRDLSKSLGLKIIHSPNVRTSDIIMRDISRNRNKALALSMGDAVIFLDDYAVIYPDFVDQHLLLLSDNTISAGMMYRHESLINDKIMADVIAGLPVEQLIPAYDLKQDGRYRGNDRYPSRGTYTGNLGIPRCAFEALNGFDPRMEGSLEDADFGMRARMMNFSSFFNPLPYTINLYTGDRPYIIQFDHNHDVEPFVAGAANHYSGNITMTENEFLKIDFLEHYRVARCKICGARGMVDATELMIAKQTFGEVIVPKNLTGGYNTFK